MLFSKQPVNLPSLEERFERYTALFKIPPERYLQLIEDLRADIIKQKKHHKNPERPAATTKCLDACVNNYASGREKGAYYAVDFGGTNIRAVRCVLDGNRAFTLESAKVDARGVEVRGLKNGLLDPKATATELFDEMANVVRTLMVRVGDIPADYVRTEDAELKPVGFTFSFGTVQTTLNSASCTGWTKGWETGIDSIDPVVRPDVDVCLLLDHAFKRKNVPAYVCAILNDTVGTLLAGSYTKPKELPDCMIGLILGTGFNMCFFDPTAKSFGYQGRIINAECGGFLTNLPANIIDMEIDDACPPRGKQLLEKMIAGLFIPEMVRRVICRVFGPRAPKNVWWHYSLATTCVFRMGWDETPELNAVRQNLETYFDWDITEMPLCELQMVKEICRLVIDRCAGLAASAIIAIASFTGRLTPASDGLTLVIDGSVYTKNPEFKAELFRWLRTLLGEELSQIIKVHVASDGSGVGACILAAICNKK